MTDIVERLRGTPSIITALEAANEIERLRKIEAIAKNLVAQKGRFNTEIAYKRLEEALK